MNGAPTRLPLGALQLADILFDFAKDRITDEIVRPLLDRAYLRDVDASHERLFAGDGS
ncbi:MAG: hypothetical protein QNJ91_03720 [Gammaproteobacteria bacterium]|nr:hypothetical protein [Gammaproteobacteria bacterium]